MRCSRLFVVFLLALFWFGTVHAAVSGIAMQMDTSSPFNQASHCHGMDGGQQGHDDSHNGLHHYTDCHACPGCLTMLPAVAAVVVLPASSQPVSWSEVSYVSHIGRLPHRPPIFS